MKKTLIIMILIAVWLLVGCMPTPTVEPSPIQSEEPSSLPEATQLPTEAAAISNADAIRATVARQFGINESEFSRIAIEEYTGTHSKGNVYGVGGGYFLVAKVNGEWVFVAGGQVEPDCALIAQNGFPVGMVPECENIAGTSAGSADADDIRAALAAHFGINENEFTRFEIVENNGTHAKGGVAANDGGGYFLVAKVDGEWVFVAGGQAAPDCVKVAQYGFPSSMVPACPSGGSNMPDCPGEGVLAATFISDVTYPDGSQVSPGLNFTKTWRIKNVGTCTWNADYQLMFDSGEMMGGSASQQLTSVHIPPGETLDISINLVAPETTGTYRGNWKLRAPNGDVFGLTNGNPIWVEVKVVSPTSNKGDNSTAEVSYPTISITGVIEDQNVTIKGVNFPSNETFDVLMNYNGTLGIDGIVVATIETGASGEFIDTYMIPAFLYGQDKIAIRLESSSSNYYTYNWFFN